MLVSFSSFVYAATPKKCLPSVAKPRVLDVSTLHELMKKAVKWAQGKERLNKGKGWGRPLATNLTPTELENPAAALTKYMQTLLPQNLKHAFFKVTNGDQAYREVEGLFHDPGRSRVVSTFFQTGAGRPSIGMDQVVYDGSGEYAFEAINERVLPRSEAPKIYVIRVTEPVTMDVRATPGLFSRSEMRKILNDPTYEFPPEYKDKPDFRFPKNSRWGGWDLKNLVKRISDSDFLMWMADLYSGEKVKVMAEVRTPKMFFFHVSQNGQVAGYEFNLRTVKDSVGGRSETYETLYPEQYLLSDILNYHDSLPKTEPEWRLETGHGRENPYVE